jgi:hypothetical protein
VQAAHAREFRRTPAGLDPDQEISLGVCDRGEQRAGGEVAIGQQEHPDPQTAQQSGRVGVGCP